MLDKISLYLMPGLDGTGLLFGPLLPHFPSNIDARVICYPGDRFLDYRSLLNLVQQEVPTDKPYVLLAESFSGPVALEFAATSPHNLVGLVLCATFVANPASFPFRWASRLGRLLFLTTPPTFIVRRFLLGRDVTPEAVTAFRDTIRTVSPKVLSARLRNVVNVDARSALSRCNVPILYLAAANDRLVSRRSLDEMLKIKADIEVQTIDGPHFLLQSRAHEAVEAIVAFLGRIGLTPTV